MNILKDDRIAPRLRYENFGFEEECEFLVRDQYDYINYIAKKFSRSEIPDDVGIFADSYFHDSELIQITAERNQITLKFELAKFVNSGKLSTGIITLNGALKSYTNQDDDFSIMDTRIEFVNKKTKRLIIWLGHNGILVIEYTHCDIVFKSGNRKIDISKIQNEDAYGSLILTKRNINERKRFLKDMVNKYKHSSESV